VLDTSADHSVTEAKWSPDGSMIAWVARVGSSRQQDIYVSRADGGDARPIAASPADEYGIAWAPDASLLAFTSTRGGAPRLYTYDFEHDKVWPASDRDGEDKASFSPDGRLIAFESTRDGDAAVYVRPPLGGSVRRATPRGGQYSLQIAARPRGP
jgi:TolB protein